MKALNAFGGRLVIALSVAVALLPGIVPNLACAAGASVAAPDPNKLEEVVVTAEKRTSTVQATPFSVTALTGPQLAAEGVTGLASLAGDTPGISIRSSGPGQTELEMRGLSSSGGSAPTVGFYIDDVPLSPPAASLNGKVVVDPDLFDLNRVEVLRGPQGTLYGSGSMGGTIKLVTNQPDLRTFSGQVHGILSSTYQGGLNPGGDVALNMPLIDDKLAIRLVATEKYTSGWVDRAVISPFPQPTDPGPACAGWNGCVRGDVTGTPPVAVIDNTNWERLVGGRASLLYKPNDRLSISLLAMAQSIRMGGYSEYDLPYSGGQEYHYQPANLNEPFHDNFHLYSATIEYSFASMKATSVTSYWKREESQTQDSTEEVFSLLNYYYVPLPPPPPDPCQPFCALALPNFVPITFTEKDTSQQFSEEFRLASTGNAPLQWIAGVFYANLHSAFIDTNQAIALGDPTVFAYAANSRNGIVYDSNNPYKIDQFAIFGEASYAFANHIKVTAGARYFSYKSEVQEWQNGLAANTGTEEPVTPSFSSSAHGVSPKINVAWEPTGNYTMYAQIAKGFRPGGFNLPLPSSCAVSQETYDPDTSWDYEIGEKARLAGGRLTINADYYYIKWQNVQQSMNQGCGYTNTQNLADATSSGPEVEVNAVLTPEVRLGLGGAINHTSFSSIKPEFLALANSSQITIPSAILNVPKYTLTSSLAWQHPLEHNHRLMLRLSDSWVGRSNDISFTQTTLPAYHLTALRAGVHSDIWSVTAFMNNIFDKRAMLSTNTTAFDWVIPSLTRVATNQPRTVGIEADYRF
jgi:outer membrane receptor protein involved in Fe transport